MGTHLDSMLSCLPQLYRDGQLVMEVLSSPAVQLESMDEEALEVRQAHWFDHTLLLEEAAGLAAILDMAPEPWQDLGEFRAWVHAMRDARLKHGAVTRQAIKVFVVDYIRRMQKTVGFSAVPPITEWLDYEAVSTESAPVESQDLIGKVAEGRPAFIDTPARLKDQPLPDKGGIEPLQRFVLSQNGLDEAPMGFLLSGISPTPEAVPMIVNLTTRRALVYRGTIGLGQRLWIRPLDDGGVEAELEGGDVTDQLYSVAVPEPGQVWNSDDVESPARALVLTRGENDLWYLPLAHYDEPGLDRFLLALADLAMHNGRWDETSFDHALFYHAPCARLHVVWRETRPASFAVHLPGGAMISPAGRLEEALADREQLHTSLDEGVSRLRGAGVSSKVHLRPFEERQAQRDALTAVMPLTVREAGTTGADSLPDAGGIFEVTGFNDSTYR